MITPWNIARHELIGLKVRVADSANKYYVGIEGRVVNETKNMLIIECRDGKERKVAKKGTVFWFWLPDGAIVEVNGNLIIGRPEERLKKRFPKK